jgi:hypothetical protein
MCICRIWSCSHVERRWKVIHTSDQNIAIYMCTCKEQKVCITCSHKWSYQIVLFSYEENGCNQQVETCSHVRRYEDIYMMTFDQHLITVTCEEDGCSHVLSASRYVIRQGYMLTLDQHLITVTIWYRRIYSHYMLTYEGQQSISYSGVV